MATPSTIGIGKLFAAFRTRGPAVEWSNQFSSFCTRQLEVHCRHPFKLTRAMRMGICRYDPCRLSAFHLPIYLSGHGCPLVTSTRLRVPSLHSLPRSFAHFLFYRSLFFFLFLSCPLLSLRFVCRSVPIRCSVNEIQLCRGSLQDDSRKLLGQGDNGRIGGPKLSTRFRTQMP